ncbi:MAG: hypothetical protein ISN29_04900, partial [Gammaproteobacteria bacterium AqS3]|nr:hypothetical protein [Gammaproteobacteria bacterium AqS3]
MNNRRLTEEQIAEVCRRYAEGQENLAQLGRDFGVSADTIVSYLKNRGVKRPGKIGSKPKLTEEQSAEVCRRYAEERESTDQLAMAFGVSKNTIASRLKSRGIGMRTGNVGAKPKLTEEQVAEICRRYAEERENLAQLARTFGVDPKTIANYLKREGVKRPGRHAGIIRLTERQIAEICRRYAEGQKNLTQLGRDFGVSATSIASHLKSRGIKRPGKVGGSLKLTEEQVAEIC